MNIVQSINSVSRKIPAWPIYVLGVLPGLIYFDWAATNQLGTDPLQKLEHQLGRWSLQILIAILLITPLRDQLKINLVKYRRALGLMAFFYAAFHVIVYLWLDRQFIWWDVWKDITKRPYIIIGAISFLIMVPLAITSNNLSIKRLGPVLWRRLHLLTYVVVICGAAHFILLRKTWQTEPFIYLGIFIVLVGYRFARNGRRVLA